jgi:hypothetical protein
MTPVKPQISKFKADKCLAKCALTWALTWALTCYGGFTHERLLSESSRQSKTNFPASCF